MRYLIVATLAALGTVGLIYGTAQPVYDGPKIVRLHRMSDGQELDIRAFSGYRIFLTARELPFAKFLEQIVGPEAFDMRSAILFCGDRCGVSMLYDQGSRSLAQADPKRMPLFVHWWGLRPAPKDTKEGE